MSRWRDGRRAWCCTHSARASWSRGQGRSSMLCSAGLPPFVFRAPCDDATTWIALVPAAIPRRSRGESVRRRSDWYQTYVNRIVNRDAVDISGLQRLADLPRLLRLIAARSGSTMVWTALANDAGIPRRTLDPYVKLLETLFLVHVLPAWSVNLTSREVKQPKLFTLDSGLASSLL